MLRRTSAMLRRYPPCAPLCERFGMGLTSMGVMFARRRGSNPRRGLVPLVAAHLIVFAGCGLWPLGGGAPVDPAVGTYRVRIEEQGHVFTGWLVLNSGTFGRGFTRRIQGNQEFDNGIDPKSANACFRFVNEVDAAMGPPPTVVTSGVARWSRFGEDSIQVSLYGVIDYFYFVHLGPSANGILTGVAPDAAYRLAREAERPPHRVTATRVGDPDPERCVSVGR